MTISTYNNMINLKRPIEYSQPTKSLNRYRLRGAPVYEGLMFLHPVDAEYRARISNGLRS